MNASTTATDVTAELTVETAPMKSAVCIHCFTHIYLICSAFAASVLWTSCFGLVSVGLYLQCFVAVVRATGKSSVVQKPALRLPEVHFLWKTRPNLM